MTGARPAMVTDAMIKALRNHFGDNWTSDGEYERAIQDVLLAMHQAAPPAMVTDAVERLETLYEQLWIAAKIGGTLTPTPEQVDDLRTLLAMHQAAMSEPIPMVLYCPNCGLQHIDEPDERTPDWTNPPHRSHLCHGCSCIWRPADVPTNGVRFIETAGKADTWPLRERAVMNRDVVERVARAIYFAEEGIAFQAWEHVDWGVKERRKKQARAAIASLMGSRTTDDKL